MLADGQGRKVGTGFPLCKHGTSSRQETLREEPLRQPDSSLTPYHPYPSPLLGRLPQSQHQGSRHPFDCQRYGFSARRPLSEKVGVGLPGLHS